MIGTGCSKKEGKYLTYTYFLLIFFIISCVTTHIIFSLYLSCSNYIYHYSNNKVCNVGMTYRFLSLLLKRAAWFTTIPGTKGKLASKGLELYTLQKFPWPIIHSYSFTCPPKLHKESQPYPSTINIFSFILNSYSTTNYHPNNLNSLHFHLEQWNPVPPIPILHTITITTLVSNQANPSQTE